MVNSVNGKADNLATVLPVVARYVTHGGRPHAGRKRYPSRPKRLAIAERIVAPPPESTAFPRERRGHRLPRHGRGHQQDEVREILRAVALVKERLGVRTVLGVSNVSFGLPARPS